MADYYPWISPMPASTKSSGDAGADQHEKNNYRVRFYNVPDVAEKFPGRYSRLPPLYTFEVAVVHLIGTERTKRIDVVLTSLAEAQIYATDLYHAFFNRRVEFTDVEKVVGAMEISGRLWDGRVGKVRIIELSSLEVASRSHRKHTGYSTEGKEKATPVYHFKGAPYSTEFTFITMTILRVNFSTGMVYPDPATYRERLTNIPHLEEALRHETKILYAIEVGCRDNDEDAEYPEDEESYEDHVRSIGRYFAHLEDARHYAIRLFHAIFGKPDGEIVNTLNERQGIESFKAVLFDGYVGIVRIVAVDTPLLASW